MIDADGDCFEVPMSDSLRAEIKEIYRRADEEGRRLTASENGRVADLLSFIEKQNEVKALGRALGSPGSAGQGSFLDPMSWGGGPGDVFVRSEGYKAVRDSSSRPQQWTTGMVEVSHSSPLEFKGTLLETGAGGPGGGLIPPAYDPGIVSKLFEPLGVSDVFGSSQTAASQMRYVVEGTATSAAAGVAEGAAKPESTLAYSEVVEPIKKIATVLPISDEFLEDAPSIQSYLNVRLSLFVRIERSVSCSAATVRTNSLACSTARATRRSIPTPSWAPTTTRWLWRGCLPTPGVRRT
ncbi:MAG TPA: phage major capsid protein [Thermoleophilaceae bacterium]